MEKMAGTATVLAGFLSLQMLHCLCASHSLMFFGAWMGCYSGQMWMKGWAHDKQMVLL
jgi:hypothetical protein